MRWKIRNSFVLALLTMLVVATGRAQDSAEPEEPNPGGAAAVLHRPSRERDFVLNIASDQKSLWTTPKQIRLEDADWLLPLGAFSAGLIASDTSIEKRLPTSTTLIQHSQSLSNYGVASLIGTTGTFYFWGRVTQNDHARETGLLGGEALANVLIDTSLLQFATGRQRPLEGNRKGQFWHGGQSFPSDHAAAAWSIASVVANEYPGPLTQLLAYGTASAVTAARVVGREHFASDAVVGSALGWWMGRQVYR
ncbi:MAG: phosphatase PAP2 family protein, partial [Terriglobales bacterium]